MAISQALAGTAATNGSLWNDMQLQCYTKQHAPVAATAFIGFPVRAWSVQQHAKEDPTAVIA